jgi:hypothetical protein
MLHFAAYEILKKGCARSMAKKMFTIFTESFDTTQIGVVDSRSAPAHR